MRHLPLKSSPTITISYRITRTRKEWAVRGEMTIQTISKQHTGGVTKKKDQPEWMANGRSSMPPGPTRASLRIQARDMLMYKSKLMRRGGTVYASWEGDTKMAEPKVREVYTAVSHRTAGILGQRHVSISPVPLLTVPASFVAGPFWGRGRQ